MPPVNDEPEGIRVFRWHGMDLTERGNQAVGNCPLCGQGGRFYVNIENGKWDCKRCGDSGNPLEFIRRLYEKSREGKSDLDALARDRGLIDSNTVWEWGCCQSVITGDWLVPGYDVAGQVKQLYRYCADTRGRMRLMASPGLGQGIFTPHDMLGEPRTLYVCEGPWDGMALWETLGLAKVGAEPTAFDDNGGKIELMPVRNLGESLRASTAVIAVPSANVFLESWVSLGAKRDVVLLYDNDHPKPHPQTKAPTPSAGFVGTKRAAGLLALAEQSPTRLLWLQWGSDGYDPQLPSGYDVRDALTTSADLGDRIKALEGILNRVHVIPESWVGEAKESKQRELTSIPCTDYRTLINAWRKTMKWTVGLDRALACMLATVTSTKAVGDQLWMRVIGPPSCGKSVLCEALSVARKHVRALSTLRGFHSGYKTDAEGSEDVSLIHQLRDKTLVVKDGDTLLQLPNRDQVLSEARDLYDRVSRTHYRHNLARSYEGVNMTFLLCGTESLRALDSSELGERFLDCVVVDKIDTELEEEIGWIVANQAESNLSHESNGRADEQHAPERTHAMRLTGGFVEFLRQHAMSRLRETITPEVALRACQRYGMFVSYMRSRPPRESLRHGGDPVEKVHRELSFRLISQLVRLAKCLAVVLGKKKVDSEVMTRVRSVALDTSRGKTFTIVGHLRQRGERGLEVRGIAGLMMYTDQHTRDFMRFLWKIGVVEPAIGHTSLGIGGGRWRLTVRSKQLWDEVMGNEKSVPN
jgi:hypothetical protein